MVTRLRQIGTKVTYCESGCVDYVLPSPMFHAGLDTTVLRILVCSRTINVMLKCAYGLGRGMFLRDAGVHHHNLGQYQAFVIMIRVIIDTAEQECWSFPDGVDTVRRKLRTGDYSVVGFEDRVCIERKSIGDLVGTVIHDWLRFVKQLHRMAGMEVCMVAIEGMPEDIYEHRYRSEADPKSVMGKVCAIAIDYGVPVVWMGKRPYCEMAALHFLEMAAIKLKD